MHGAFVVWGLDKRESGRERERVNESSLGWEGKEVQASR